MDSDAPSPGELPPAVAELLRAATPRAWVTPAITGLLVACFAGSVALGVAPFSPTVGQLIEVGASFGPLATEGQWWRILTASLLHAGLLHLGFNLTALWSAGLLTERLYGNAAYSAVYLLSAVGAGLASIAVKPLGVSVGASGAIFGVYGALLAFVFTHRGAIPKEMLLQQRKGLFGFLVFNLIFGVVTPGIDLAGHLGGLVTGLAAGWLLQRDLEHPAEQRGRRTVRAAALAMALAVGAWGVRERVARAPDVRVSALDDRATSAIEAGDNRRGIDLCTQALAIRPDARALWLRGLAELRLSRPDNALTDLRASLALDDNPGTRVALCDAAAGSSGTDAARIEAAVVECSRAADASDRKSFPLAQRAWLRVKQGRKDEALADLASVLASSPGEPRALQLRASVLLERGRLDEAERDCAVLVKVVTSGFSPSATCAEVARRRGDHQAAVERATFVLERRPDHLPALHVRARAHQSAGDLDAAIADFDRILELDPSDASALNGRGWFRIARGDFAGGRDDADRSLASRPHWPAALGTRCFALAGLGERAAARRDCSESVRLAPDNAIDRGMIAFLDGHRAEAVRLWTSAGRARPDEVRALAPWIARASGR